MHIDEVIDRSHLRHRSAYQKAGLVVRVKVSFPRGTHREVNRILVRPIVGMDWLMLGLHPARVCNPGGEPTPIGHFGLKASPRPDDNYVAGLKHLVSLPVYEPVPARAKLRAEVDHQVTLGRF